jgi:DNA-binding MarR family transcriptional regulator
MAQEYLRTARRFLDIMPRLVHGMNGALHGAEGCGVPATLAQLRCLAALSSGPCSLGALADRFDVTAPTMSRLVNTLVQRGWVERAHDPHDRRQVLLSLTAPGEAVRSELAQCAAEHLADLLGDLTAEERKALDQALRALERVVTARRTTHDAPSAKTR